MTEEQELAKKLAQLDEASESIIALFEKYGVTDEDIEKALEKAAEITFAKMYPEFAKQAA